MVRSLVNKLPVMITPSWVRTPTVIAYLIWDLNVEEGSAVLWICCWVGWICGEGVDQFHQQCRHRGRVL